MGVLNISDKWGLMGEKGNKGAKAMWINNGRERIKLVAKGDGMVGTFNGFIWVEGIKLVVGLVVLFKFRQTNKC